MVNIETVNECVSIVSIIMSVRLPEGAPKGLIEDRINKLPNVHIISVEFVLNKFVVVEVGLIYDDTFNNSMSALKQGLFEAVYA